ncbi:formamidopyrimidine-DNA glycosylase isoform X3 [Actinidia eriantha]|uniref:formamidopyrimidine-DNA glycosylase isoform X3 n=1 Tax=Actinidia eriantha TaxID=165200 RepID=UPI00258C6B88|nr:formamidopyrimidine-DNA glycosylase isoform X3 [Actinidia eriantha]
MPELPEVEAARRAIEEYCIGKKIKRSVVADDSKVIDGVSPSDFEVSLLGKTIVAAHRKGKNMWLQLDSPPFPSFQFGMAGAIYIKGVAVTKYKRSAVNDTDEWPSKYSKIFIELDDGLELSFTDKRRFAKVRLLKNPASAPPISELGPDALLEPMTIDELINSLSKKKIGIKALLLDQSFISGIGNWIADEVLYQARIHPLQIASSLSKESCIELHKCIKEVIQYAVEVDADCSRFPLEWLFHFRWGRRPGQKAVDVGADGSQFPSSWIFHSREKKPGKAFVDGKKIEFIAAGGRTTAYVPELQKLIGSQAAKAPSKLGKKTVKGRKNENSDDDPNAPGSEEEEKAKSVKSKGGRSTTRHGRKLPPAKRKISESDDEDDDDGSNDDSDETDEKTRTTKKPPAKRKSKKAMTMTSGATTTRVTRRKR